MSNDILPPDAAKITDVFLRELNNEEDETVFISQVKYK